MSLIKSKVNCVIQNICFEFSEEFHEDIIGCLKSHGAIIPEKAKDHLADMIQHQIGTFLPEDLLGEKISEIMDSDSEEECDIVWSCDTCGLLGDGLRSPPGTLKAYCKDCIHNYSKMDICGICEELLDGKTSIFDYCDDSDETVCIKCFIDGTDTGGQDYQLYKEAVEHWTEYKPDKVPKSFCDYYNYVENQKNAHNH